MSRLWNWINRSELTNQGKITTFLLLNCLIFSFLGFLSWLLVSRFALSTLDWALCFVGYPGFFAGFVGGNIFLCRQ